MHIPDGYLSPSACVVGYAVSTPFWYMAVKRVKRLLNTRLVPLISVFSAFCFVVMMFNLPIPGGTTAHAIGIGIATIVLGPWAALLAISIALLIQALFFGDGGITSYAFNCFNMGIVAAFVAYGLYRLIASGADITAKRRVIAAGIAGYAAINAGAFCAAIEFGVQPLLFHTANGTPLYAPYSLSVAIPSMMLAHLTVAGVAELIITAGIVAYLQRVNPELLSFTAGGRMTPEESRLAQVESAGGWRTTRWLWIGVAVLMICSPLGLLASASAWGEWGAADFASSSGRAAIRSQPLNHTASVQTPHGLQELSSVWTAPMPDYMPVFMHSEVFGYVLSALVGGGLIILVFLAAGWLTGLIPARSQARSGH